MAIQWCIHIRHTDRQDGTGRPADREHYSTRLARRARLETHLRENDGSWSKPHKRLDCFSNARLSIIAVELKGPCVQ
jgi:hypothetical protein